MVSIVVIVVILVVVVVVVVESLPAALCLACIINQEWLHSPTHTFSHVWRVRWMYSTRRVFEQILR